VEPRSLRGVRMMREREAGGVEGVEEEEGEREHESVAMRLDPSAAGAVAV
jgi:hypothetical protein